MLGDPGSEAQAGTKKELMVKVGEKLAERSAQNPDKEKFVIELMREWDPNRDGTITKMEFTALLMSDVGTWPLLMSARLMHPGWDINGIAG